MTSTQQKTCNTNRDGGLKKFLYDNGSGNYAMIGDASEDELYGNLRRKLPALAFLGEDDDDDADDADGGGGGGGGVAKKLIIPTSFVDERSLDEQSQIVYGRQCTCARTDDVYCPVGAYLCRIVAPNSRTYRVQCEGDAQGVAEDRYQHVLRQEIDRIANHAHQQRLRAQRLRNTNRVSDNTRDGTPASPPNRRISPMIATTNSVEVGRRVAVGLKTRSYTTHEQEATNECTICLSEFANGDKVGDLPCSHIFHVEPCLKKWIVRRNHCPLCQANNLAAPTAKVATFLSEPFTNTDEAGTTIEEIRSTVEHQYHSGGNMDELPSVIRELEGRREDDRPGSDSYFFVVAILNGVNKCSMV
eukprot:scaffold244_cov172-Amphora_coffeaeformis.AAC.10